MSRLRHEDWPGKNESRLSFQKAARYPFRFQLTAGECAEIKSVKENTDSAATDEEQDKSDSSQTAMSSSRRGAAYRPRAFTEHGALMAATVLNSPRAGQLSLYVIRALVRMREELAANATILKRLAQIDQTLLQHDAALRTVWARLQPLLQPAPEPPPQEMGFHTSLKKP